MARFQCLDCAKVVDLDRYTDVEFLETLMSPRMIEKYTSTELDELGFTNKHCWQMIEMEK